MRARLLALTAVLAGCSGEPKPVDLPTHAFQLEPCAAVAGTTVEPHTLAVALLRDRSVPRAALLDRLGGAAAWWARHEVTLEVAHESEGAVPVALQGPERYPRGVIVGQRLAPPRHGLGFDPHAIAALPGTPLGDELGREAPVVFAGWTELARLHPDDAALTLAHELGHLLGLEHTDEPDHLMTPGRFRCVPTGP